MQRYESFLNRVKRKSFFFSEVQVFSPRKSFGRHLSLPIIYVIMSVI